VRKTLNCRSGQASGAQNQDSVKPEPKKIPKTKYVFGELSRIRLLWAYHHLLPSRLYCRLRSFTGSCSPCHPERMWRICSRAIPPIGNCTLPRRLLFSCSDYTRPSHKLHYAEAQFVARALYIAIMLWRCTRPGRLQRIAAHQSDLRIRRRYPGWWRTKYHRLRWWTRWDIRVRMRRRRCNLQEFSWSWFFYSSIDLLDYKLTHAGRSVNWQKSVLWWILSYTMPATDIKNWQVLKTCQFCKYSEIGQPNDS
jgi:hypothetical protein